MTPCPFCGSSDIRYSIKTGTSNFRRIYHACWYCWDCNTYGPRVLYRPAEGVRRSTVEKDEILKAAALKLWETRRQRRTFENELAERVEMTEDDLVETLCMEGPNQFKTLRYKPTCQHGCTDCIYDPAYIYTTYPAWYKSLYGDQAPDKVNCENCLNGERYDDEDK